MADNTGRIQRGRPFAPGQSGNPAGKPKGARHRAVEALDLLGRNVGEDVVMAVIRAAKGGDMRAAEIILRRCWPEAKGRPVALDLPAVVDAATVVEALTRITAAAAAGEITPDEATALAGLVEHHRRAIETSEFETRLRAVEERLNHEND